MLISELRNSCFAPFAVDFNKLNFDFSDQPLGLRFAGHQFPDNTLQPRLFAFQLSHTWGLRQTAIKQDLLIFKVLLN